MANWLSLGILQPSITNWQNFPISVDGDLNLFQIKITEQKNIFAGKAYLRINYSNNLFSGKWVIFYPKYESEFFLIDGLPSQINQLKTIQIKKSQWNPNYNYSVELKVLDEPVNETTFEKVISKLSSFDKSIQDLSDRINSLPDEIFQINNQLESVSINQAKLLTVLLGI